MIANVDIENLTREEYANLLGRYGGEFLVKYINKSDKEDSSLQKRVKNMNILPRNNSVQNENFNVQEGLMIFKMLDKIKLIDILGKQKFCQKFNLPISLYIINIDNNSQPQWFQFLEEDPPNKFLELIEKTITDSILWSKEFEEDIMNYWEFYHFNHYNAQLQDTEAYDLMSGKKVEEEMEEPDNLIVELATITEGTEIDIINTVDEATQYLSHLHVFFYYQEIIEYNELTDRFVDYLVQLYSRVLENLIFFYNPDKNNDDGIYNIKTPMFVKKKSDKFQTKEEYFGYIVKEHLKTEQTKGDENYEEFNK